MAKRIVDVFLDGSVANAAHVSGLLLGLSMGFFSGMSKKS
jgi:membrane associated rhomboid family serine protease